MSEIIEVSKDILEENKKLAHQNREVFDKHNIYVINLLSSPGAGKTTLLEKTIAVLKNEIRFGVIEGDIATRLDYDRLKKYNIELAQINTDKLGGECHLDARMIKEAIKQLNLNNIDILIIENIGNLVCPAEFELGENIKIVILSVTEGDDKAKKYPLIFNVSDVLIINKIDLLPYTNFDITKFRKDISLINPNMKIFELSALNNTNMDEWFSFISTVKNKVKATESHSPR